MGGGRGTRWGFAKGSIVGCGFLGCTLPCKQTVKSLPGSCHNGTFLTAAQRSCCLSIYDLSGADSDLGFCQWPVEVSFHCPPPPLPFSETLQYVQGGLARAIRSGMVIETLNESGNPLICSPSSNPMAKSQTLMTISHSCTRTLQVDQNLAIRCA